MGRAWKRGQDQALCLFPLFRLPSIVSGYSTPSTCQARKVLGWPKICELALTLLWGYTDKRMKFAQFWANLASFSLEAKPTGLGRLSGSNRDSWQSNC